MVDKFLKSLKEKGWRQTQIAEKVGLKQAYISELSRGANCSLETAIKLADAFNVTLDEVVGRKPSTAITPTEEMILRTTNGDDHLARIALRSAQGEKLVKETETRKGRGRAA